MSTRRRSQELGTAMPEGAGTAGDGGQTPAWYDVAAMMQQQGWPAAGGATAESVHAQARQGGTQSVPQLPQQQQLESGPEPQAQQAPVPPAKPPDEEEVARAAAEQQRREEDAVLAQARRIREVLCAAKVPPCPEPKRGKTHWDCLLEEMAWLAKEFGKERAWKLKTAKKYALAVQRSNLDLESRVLVRAQNEEKERRKRAAWIAKEVMGFWGKAQRVVLYKVRTEVEARKKEVMDKQLDFLLGQTQKYSTMLAERLKGEGPTAITAAAATEGPSSWQPSASGEPSAGPSAEANQGGVRQRSRRTARGASPAPSSSAAVSGTAEGEDSDEYRSGEDDDADNEATIEEEEALAAAEGRDVKKEEADELAGLDEEADLPLEELLARYGNYHLAAQMDVEESAGSGDERLAGAGSDAECKEGTAALLEQEDTAAQQGQQIVVTSKGAEVSVKAEPQDGTTAPSEEAAAALEGAQPSQPAAGAAERDASDDEDEYRSGEDDDADNEATIEEEEALAAAEGRDVKKEEADELAGLDEEADLPLEELLARYGNYHLAMTAEGEAEEGVSDEEMPDAPLSYPSAAAKAVKVEPAKSEPQEEAQAGTEQLGGDDDDDADIKGANSQERMGNALMQMAELQPMGTTLATTQIKTKTPFLIKGVLREYQQIGLDWLVTLYHKRLNGILADEMGLGKTIQTIALLAHLACERGDWGPHLVVVPTSVMLNWEMEFKKWCPAFKLLTYYGGVKERAAKRQGWSKPNAFHVCITSYTLVLQDARMFKRKKWKYLILDEAHMIKNWKSQRWQTLLNFNSKRRLLITGTPLQNDLMELWSLMHFLMPQVFASHAQFKDWFSNPLTGMVEGSAEMNRAIVERLHAVLRPFLLRRLKKDVEKQLPQKHEHVVYCRLSKRQRKLYEEYMASGNTRATLASGNFLGIMNCLMQLRKVCNHPDLFEGRPIVSAFDMQPLQLRLPNAVPWLLQQRGPFEAASLDRFLVQPPGMAAWEAQAVQQLALGLVAFATPHTTPQEDVELLLGQAASGGLLLLQALPFRPAPETVQAVVASVQTLALRRRQWRAGRTALLGRLSAARTAQQVALGSELQQLLRIDLPARDVHRAARSRGRTVDLPACLLDMVKLPERRAAEADEMLRTFCCAIPKARVAPPELWCSHPDTSLVNVAANRAQTLTQAWYAHSGLLHTARLRTQLFFPDRRLIQFDCGKLQELAVLLARLKAGGHKCLIFTQMSKMLDVLEAFLNLHAYTYVRLDGATKPEQRQILTQRFNSDPKIFCFILSTRSGGVGMNLIGADTVIFYDSDWNPAMDAQAQDRCHRIGQTREVHIYRLVSEHTIEENILKKSDQKRHLDFLAIQSGGFTTDILTSLDPQALLGGLGGSGGVMSAEEIRAAMRAAEDEGDAAAAAAVEREAAAELDEFTKEPLALPSEAGEAGDDTTTRDSAGGAVAGAAGAGGAATSRERTPGVAVGGAAAAAETVAEAEEDDMMKDMAALTGGTEGGIAALESALCPVERYAVRFVELEQPTLDKNQLAAQVEAEYKVEEFDVTAIEAAEEEREAEIDEDEEAARAADWDETNALAAYQRQVERAQEAERKREEADRRWRERYYLDLGMDAETAAAAANGDPVAQAMAIPLIAAQQQREALAAAQAAAAAAAAGSHQDSGSRGWGVAGRGSKGGRGGRGGRARGSSAAAAWEVADTAGSREGASSKRQRVLLPLRPYLQPWDAREDFVLCSVVVQLLGQGQPLAHPVFVAAADALSAGAAAPAASDAEAVAHLGKQRSAAACQQRYVQLCAAAQAASGHEVTAASGRQHVEATLTRLRQQLQQQLTASEGAGNVLSIVQQVLQQAAGALAPQDGLAALLQQQLHLVAPGAPLPPGFAVDVVDAAPLAQARQLMAAVQQQCGGAVARAITTRLQQTLPAPLGSGALSVAPAAGAGLPQLWPGALPSAAQELHAAGTGTPPPPVAALAAFGLPHAPAAGSLPFPLPQ